MTAYIRRTLGEIIFEVLYKEFKMKVFKLEVMVIDEGVDDIGQAESLIEGTRFANHTNVSLITCKEADIGEWDDENPLNYSDTQEAEMNRLFPVGQK